MAFIFNPESDPRRENMTETTYRAGSKVKYRGMTMPAEIISGPHKSPGATRYLITKADGNVSLVSEHDLSRIVPRLDKVAGTLAMVLYRRPYYSLDGHAQVKVAQAAARALAIADETRGEV
jgi:hypothetical protein